MAKTNVFAIKVGEKRYMESFAKGQVYFRTLKSFQDEKDDFRGDKNEAVYYENPENFLVNGIDVTEYIKNHISDIDKIEIKGSVCKWNDWMIFCASLLENNNLNYNGLKHEIIVKRDFYESMRKFGRYAIIFEVGYFLGSLKQETSRSNSFLSSDRVSYINKSNYEDVDRYLEKCCLPEDIQRCYIKDLKYSKQQEWRCMVDKNIIDRRGCLDDKGGFVVQLEEFPTSLLLDLDEAKVTDNFVGL